MSIEISSMSNQKILYVTTEMFPYQEGTNMALEVNKMALKMHQEGNDVRVFMPRFGLISERKYQLHEVIRLSGMNIIINDLDQPLIVKVASLPGERLQVYFIDNDEFHPPRSPCWAYARLCDNDVPSCLSFSPAPANICQMNILSAPLRWRLCLGIRAGQVA